MNAARVEELRTLATLASRRCVDQAAMGNVREAVMALEAILARFDEVLPLETRILVRLQLVQVFDTYCSDCDEYRNQHAAFALSLAREAQFRVSCPVLLRALYVNKQASLSKELFQADLEKIDSVSAVQYLMFAASTGCDDTRRRELWRLVAQIERIASSRVAADDITGEATTREFSMRVLLLAARVACVLSDDLTQLVFRRSELLESISAVVSTRERTQLTKQDGDLVERVLQAAMSARILGALASTQTRDGVQSHSRAAELRDLHTQAVAQTQSQTQEQTQAQAHTSHGPRELDAGVASLVRAYFGSSGDASSTLMQQVTMLCQLCAQYLSGATEVSQLASVACGAMRSLDSMRDANLSHVARSVHSAAFDVASEVAMLCLLQSGRCAESLESLRLLQQRVAQSAAAGRNATSSFVVSKTRIVRAQLLTSLTAAVLGKGDTARNLSKRAFKVATAPGDGVTFGLQERPSAPSGGALTKAWPFLSLAVGRLCPDDKGHLQTNKCTADLKRSVKYAGSAHPSIQVIAKWLMRSLTIDDNADSDESLPTGINDNEHIESQLDLTVLDWDARLHVAKLRAELQKTRKA